MKKHHLESLKKKAVKLESLLMKLQLFLIEV